MLRLVRHPIHIFTASPSGSFQHALWALSPLKCCGWHQPAKLACKLAATPKRENNSSPDQNSPQPFHLHARQRVLYRKCLTDNNVAEWWLKTFKTDYNFRTGVLSLLLKAPSWIYKGFKWRQGLTGNGGTVRFSCEMGQENLMRVNHRVWHALWTWSAAKGPSFLPSTFNPTLKDHLLQKILQVFPIIKVTWPARTFLENQRKMLLHKDILNHMWNLITPTVHEVMSTTEVKKCIAEFSNISPLQHQIDGTVWADCENVKQVLPRA